MPNYQSIQKRESEITKIHGLNIPAINKCAGELMVSARELFTFTNLKEFSYEFWLNKFITKNCLAMPFDDYVKSELGEDDYLVSISLAERLLMISGNDNAYHTMCQLHNINLQYETGRLFF